MSKRTLIICDIDGVLADCSQRLKYLEAKDYDKFYGVSMADDTPLHAGIELMKHLSSGQDYNATNIILVTGRPERTRNITKNWLIANGVINRLPKMLMRKDDDHRPSPEVKIELLEPILREPTTSDNYDYIWFVDDDPENVKTVCKAYPEVIGITFGIGRMND